MLFQDAFQTAQQLLDDLVRSEHADEIVIGSCQDHASAWVFGYNTRQFLQDGVIAASLAGNGPVIVPKDGSAPYLGESSRPVEDQL